MPLVSGLFSVQGKIEKIVCHLEIVFCVYLSSLS